MEYKLLYALRSGKNIKLIYYIKNMLGMLIPNIFFRRMINPKREQQLMELLLIRKNQMADK